MRRRKIAIIVALYLLALLIVRFAWMVVQTDSERAAAENGLLDLSRWNPASQPILSLSGEWEFYPSRLLTFGQADGEGPASAGVVPELVSVPGNWKKHLDTAQGSSFGYGTYRLRIVLPDGALPELAVRVPSLSVSSALYVNGRLLGSSGRPAENASSYEADVVPYSVRITAEGGILDLVLQEANFDDRVKGGMTTSIKLGTAHAIDRAYWISAGAQAAIILLTAMHSLYAFALYFIGTRQKTLLIFALLGMCSAVSVLCNSDLLLTTWFGVGFEAAYATFYLSYLGGAALLLQYVRHLLPEDASLRHSRWHLVASVLFGLFVLAMPARVYSYADSLHSLLLLTAYAGAPVYFYRAVRRGAPDAIYPLLGTVALASSLLWGLIDTAFLLDYGFYPFDILAFFVAFALYWFKRYFRNADEAARLTQRLQAADKRKDEFLVHTSHELRNPLHGILNVAQAVIDSGERADAGANRERLELLLSVGKRMSFLLSDLIDLNRLRENRLRVNPKPIRLQASAAGVLDMVRFMAEGKPIQLEHRIPSSLPALLADENRLLQILFNLLHNAVKFTNEGRVWIEAEAEGGQIVIQVADTGIGMDKATIERIFQPYEQGEVQEETNASGFGLGLAISKQLIELQGGRLTVRSAPHAGSVFRFTLPAAEASEEESAKNEVAAAWLEAGADEEKEEGKEEAAPPGSGPTAIVPRPGAPEADDRARILAIDDDPVNLRILKHALAADRYEIAATTSGAEALVLLNSKRWDLVIADVMMPGISGYEVARTVRTMFTSSELPILLLTARDRAEDIEAGFRAGANDYIVKPVDTQEMRMRVKALTDVARSSREQKRLEAAWLQAQIQPHFLFNTLNSIAALADVDVARMRDLLSAFGEYLRGSFDTANSEQLVPLRKELDLVRAYLYIEKERFEDRIRIEWEADDHLQLLVPPLSIQPLVENAVRHGIRRRSAGGTVRIRVRESGDGVEIAVEDDGDGLEPELLARAQQERRSLGRHSGIGLSNTDRRLKQTYGEGLRILSRPGEGTIVSFVIPKPSSSP
ncbi:ATP-binding protein [Cohnella fermenti]|nr:ATP-binding protein [Cohnella fermenti]